MKTFICEYDLAAPVPYIWGVEGYERVLVLIRWGLQALHFVEFPHDPTYAAIYQSEIECILEHLGMHPLVRGHFAERPAVDLINLPPISVVVCTRDRPRSLERCLKSLVTVEYRNFEVIVVDNGSGSSETADIVASMRFTYLREDRLGLDWARNRGLRVAKHDIVAFTDDDVQVDVYWLQGLAHGFLDEAVQAVTGLVLPAELETRAQHLFEMYGGMSKGLQPIRFPPGAVDIGTIIQSYRVGVGANMAFRKRLFVEIGDFDTALDVGTPSGGAGDLDMFHRVLIRGYEVRYEPQALVWHRHRRDMAALRRQIYNYGQSHGVYLIKRWQEQKIERRALALYIFGKWVPGLMHRLLLRLIGRHPLPLSMLWAELMGALHSPCAFRKTYRNDLQFRKT
jgi:glycosyltransferase involved in cell wall biosynthesis